MIKYKCFYCDHKVAYDNAKKRVRCPYCGSKILFKPRTAVTKIKAI